MVLVSEAKEGMVAYGCAVGCREIGESDGLEMESNKVYVPVLLRGVLCNSVGVHNASIARAAIDYLKSVCQGNSDVVLKTELTK